MRRKKWIATCLYTSLVASALSFFLFPHTEYVPRLLYLIIACAFTVTYALQRNIRGAILCGVGALFIAMIIPNSRTLRTAELILLVLASFAAYVVNRYMQKNHKQAE
ncbi:hypothetical protein GCM10025857_02020 [Alicyclobacillus contaminans]|uniref:hypothetical protein n=1 Tax=Alicyclobacillus contaminans TaxID=392016 RepID=UPI000417E06B|nr:hypothetical protein [Alicyclobacillus contaminans]GMA48845.1 hypothetical protein GCM10025857_02020 [Alicyclobacillus contaminans]